MAPQVERRADPKARLRREAANGYADRFVNALRVALDGQDKELVIEVSRGVIRRLSRVVENCGDIGRAHGVLAGAATDLSPAYEPNGRGHAEAEALFARKDAA